MSISGFCSRARPPSKVTRTQRVMLSIVRRRSSILKGALWAYAFPSNPDRQASPPYPVSTPKNNRWAPFLPQSAWPSSKKPTKRTSLRGKPHGKRNGPPTTRKSTACISRNAGNTLRSLLLLRAVSTAMASRPDERPHDPLLSCRA